MKRKERLRIEEGNEQAVLDARLHINRENAKELRVKAEVYYSTGIGELYDINILPKRLLRGNLRIKNESEPEKSRLCHISEKKIILHTKDGYLIAKIKKLDDDNNYSIKDAKIKKLDDDNNYLIKVRAEGEILFIDDFYKCLRDISQHTSNPDPNPKEKDISKK